MDAKAAYGISEAARELGLSAEWLRQGEKRGSLPPARPQRRVIGVSTHLLQMRPSTNSPSLLARRPLLPAARLSWLPQAYCFWVRASSG